VLLHLLGEDDENDSGLRGNARSTPRLDRPRRHLGGARAGRAGVLPARGAARGRHASWHVDCGRRSATFRRATSRRGCTWNADVPAERDGDAGSPTTTCRRSPWRECPIRSDRARGSRSRHSGREPRAAAGAMSLRPPVAMWLGSDGAPKATSGALAPTVVAGGKSAPLRCASSALDELEQVGVELVLVRERYPCGAPG
jgi:hypothetical protein